MTVLKQYVRKSNGQLKGCIVAVKEDDKVGIGHSLCRSTDSFNKNFATELAIGRAKKVLEGRQTEIPESLMYDHAKMYDRATKFFKGYTIEH